MDWSFDQECLGAFPMYFIGKVGVAKTRSVEVGTKSPGPSHSSAVGQQACKISGRS